MSHTHWSVQANICHAHIGAALLAAAGGLRSLEKIARTAANGLGQRLIGDAIEEGGANTSIASRLAPDFPDSIREISDWLRSVAAAKSFCEMPCRSRSRRRLTPNSSRKLSGTGSAGGEGGRLAIKPRSQIGPCSGKFSHLRAGRDQIGGELALCGGDDPAKGAARLATVPEPESKGCVSPTRRAF